MNVLWAGAVRRLNAGRVCVWKIWYRLGSSSFESSLQFYTRAYGTTHYTIDLYFWMNKKWIYVLEKWKYTTCTSTWKWIVVCRVFMQEATETEHICSASSAPNIHSHYAYTVTYTNCSFRPANPRLCKCMDQTAMVLVQFPIRIIADRSKDRVSTTCFCIFSERWQSPAIYHDTFFDAIFCVQKLYSTFLFIDWLFSEMFIV